MSQQKRSNRQRMDNMENKFDEHIRRHIIDDLLRTRSNGKPYFSYKDIAERYNVSTSMVQRIAVEEDLTRRNRA